MAVPNLAPAAPWYALTFLLSFKRLTGRLSRLSFLQSEKHVAYFFVHLTGPLRLTPFCYVSLRYLYHIPDLCPFLNAIRLPLLQ